MTSLRVGASMAVALLLMAIMMSPAAAQSGIRSLFAPLPPAEIPGGAGGGVGSSLAAPEGSVGGQRTAPRPFGSAGVGDPGIGAAGRADYGRPPSAMGQLALSARYGADNGPIRNNLHWRIFPDQADSTGQFRMIREERGPNPVFVLPPGSYVVHVGLGYASAARRVQLGPDTAREVFDLPVGGVRFAGHVGNTRIPSAQLKFEIYPGSQFDPGEKRPIASDIPAERVVLLPEGTYHVVSTYGDGNAVMRYDLRVSTARLTDARINHRAAAITLKLVGEFGGEAIANTAWSVLTPGGDVIKESIGAFPTVVLAEGEYIALARNDGRVFNREFRVESGVDRDVEVLSR